MRWSEHRGETSAIQYNAPGSTGAATGIAFVAQNDMGYINVSKWAQNFMNTDGGVDLDSNYFRIAATPTYNDWAMVVGLGKMGGSSFNSGLAVTTDTDQTFFDFEAQGEVAGKELGVYAQHAKAPKNANKNAYNTGGAAGNPDRKAWTIGADYSFIPHVLSVGLAYRNADNGKASNVNGDDAWTINAVYDLYQNVALHAIHSQYSGSAHDAPGAQKRLTTLMLEAAW